MFSVMRALTTLPQAFHNANTTERSSPPAAGEEEHNRDANPPYYDDDDDDDESIAEEPPPRPPESAATGRDDTKGRHMPWNALYGKEALKVRAMSAKGLKEGCKAKGIDCSDCIEKEDLVRRFLGCRD